MTSVPPFHFHTERRLVRLTGRRARTLHDLLGHLEEVSGACIFYHTHHLYLAHHFRRPDFYNEFALWADEALQDSELAEKLSAIDILAFTAIRQLREALVDVIARHVRERGAGDRACPEGEAFHFCQSQSFVMPTGIVAGDPRDFFAKLPLATRESLFFHFFGARLRLGRPTNDFSAWLGDWGETAAAAAIDRLDPYVVTLDELRDQMIDIGEGRR